MTKKQIARLREGIAPYKEQQDKLIVIIEKHGGKLHQDDFDKEFEDIMIKDGKAYRNDNFFGFVKFDLLLGSLYQGNWAKWLDMMQCMVKVGKVQIEGKIPNVYYCMVKRKERGRCTIQIDPNSVNKIRNIKMEAA